MIPKKLIFADAQSYGKSRPWSNGVMEYWSVEKKDIKSLAITPALQRSNAPKLTEIESYHYGIPFWDNGSLDFR